MIAAAVLENTMDGVPPLTMDQDWDTYRRTVIRDSKRKYLAQNRKPGHRGHSVKRMRNLETIFGL